MAFIPANQKIMRVGAENNSGNLAGMQPTTQAIYDTFDLSGASTSGNFTIPFFQGVNSKTFPFTNLSQNRLTAGRSFAVQQFYFSVITIASGLVTKVQTLDECTYPTLQKAEMSLLVSNTQVIDRYPITGSIGPWNRDASIITNASQYSPLGATTAAAEVQLSKFRSSAVKVLPAQPVILPDQEFIVNVQIPALAAALPTAGTTYLQLTLEGFGTLFAPNGTL
jgi:hypothetical protein